MPRTLAPVFFLISLARKEARPPSCAWPKESFELARSAPVLGNVLAVLVLDALADGDDALAVFVVDVLHLGHKRVEVEIHLRQIDEVRPVALIRGQRGGGGQPAGVAAIISTTVIIPVSYTRASW